MARIDLATAISDAGAAPAGLSTPREEREHAFTGMRTIDTSGNPRIALLMQLVGDQSRADGPSEVLDQYLRTIRAAFGPRGVLVLSTRGLEAGQFRITRWRTFDGVERVGSKDPLFGSDNQPVRSGGLFGTIIRSAYPELIHHFHLRNDPVFGDELAGFGSMLAVPVFLEGEPLVWAVLLDRDPQGLTMLDLENGILRANLIGTAMHNVENAGRLRAANARIRREVDQIATIQRALLPVRMPQMSGLTIATSYETFDRAGGDLYDVMLIGRTPSGEPDPNGPLAMLIADASGHGPAAAVVTAMLNAIIYSFPHGGDSPAAVLRYANRHLMSKHLEGTFVTAFYAVYEPSTRLLRYSRAGHNPPLVKVPGPGGPVSRLDDAGGSPLGVLDDIELTDGSVTLQPGHTLVMYTDGIVEATNPSRQMFGMQGIERALHECTGEPQCVVRSITAALKAHEAGVRPGDDQTIVALRVDE
jgi:sigma-B regulation protein RsbU (phosphoserine phosphatase)